MATPETRLSRRSAHFELFRDTNASIKHFSPVDFSDGYPRDRFGNRVIRSGSRLAYLDREGDSVRAAFLVSREGEDFLRGNKGILRAMEQVIIDNEISDKKGSKGKAVSPDLGGEKYLKRRYEKDGNQSKIFVLEAGKKKIVVKKTQTESIDDDDLGPPVIQPYFNEMLQIQAMALDLGDDLARLGIFMPSFLFATGQVCGVKFENGDHPNPGAIKERVLAALNIVKTYIESQNSVENPLWDNVWVDDFISSVKPCNLIERKDKSLVWIDPLLYETPILGLKEMQI